MNLVNFRDLGGVKTSGGRKIKANRLLRSGELVQLDEEGKAVLNQHQLAKVIDLRSEDELAKRPDDRLHTIDYQWIDIMKDVQEDSSMDALLQAGELAAVDRHMKQIYTNLVENDGAKRGYRQYFEQLLATESGGVLFHCFAGKDRTGMAAAYALELLDVPRTAIYQDYLQTNSQRKKPNEALFAELREQGATAQQIAGIKIAMEVSPTYLDHAYHLIETNYGSMQNYAEEALALSKQDQKDLKSLYLE
ncbi:tyrosine-protein phosphatase [uncultured Enterococcus sp.]|uniref:tyrosine-protein phosphatase n=1 Tax=uncultured Enterococcus sp. TaxID=167972 RepID=UPI002599E68C|nr:tyrosine-protein phosphatase [uncultured Enterococcus sp.]